MKVRCKLYKNNSVTKHYMNYNVDNALYSNLSWWSKSPASVEIGQPVILNNYEFSLLLNIIYGSDLDVKVKFGL